MWLKVKEIYQKIANIKSNRIVCSEMANVDNSSEISDSSESVNETNNVSSTTKSENFNNWTINSRAKNNVVDNGLMKLNKKAFTVLIEPEGENNENREVRQTPSARWVWRWFHFKFCMSKKLCFLCCSFFPFIIVKI